MEREKDARERVTQGLGVVLILLLVMISLSPPVSRAQEPELPVIADGVWEGVMTSGSRVRASGSTTTGEFYGETRFTSSGGTLDGAWNLTGTGELTTENGYGTAEYMGEGVVTGPSSGPRFVAQNLTIHMAGVVDGHPFEATLSPPAGESAIRILLTRATCSQVMGTWEAEGDGFSGQGSFVAVRVADLRAEEARDYLEEVTNLLIDAHAFTESMFLIADAEGLNDLVDRAENLYGALRRNDDCGLDEEAAGYLNLIADAVAHLLDFALSNPSAFNDFQLFQLIGAAARTGVIGAGAIGETAEGLESRLSTELADRLDHAIEVGDEISIDIVIAGAAIIGDWELMEQAQAAKEEL
jgi:hypothetical protein